MNIFWGMKNIFGVLEIPDIFWVKGRCGARAYVRRTNQSSPPSPGFSHLNEKQNVDPDELTYQKSLFKKKPVEIVLPILFKF